MHFALRNISDAHQLATAALRWARTFESVSSPLATNASGLSSDCLLRASPIQARKAFDIVVRTLDLQNLAAEAVLRAKSILVKLFGRNEPSLTGQKPLVYLTVFINTRETLELAWCPSALIHKSPAETLGVRSLPQEHGTAYGLMRVLKKEYLNEPTLDPGWAIRAAQNAQQDATICAFQVPAEVLSAGCELAIDAWPSYPRSAGGSLLVLQTAGDRARLLLEKEIKEVAPLLAAEQKDMAARLKRAGLDSLAEVTAALQEAEGAGLTPARMLSLKKGRRITMAQVDGLNASMARMQTHQSKIDSLAEALRLLPQVYEATRVRLHPCY